MSYFNSEIDYNIYYIIISKIYIHKQYWSKNLSPYIWSLMNTNKKAGADVMAKSHDHSCSWRSGSNAVETKHKKVHLYSTNSMWCKTLSCKLQEKAFLPNFSWEREENMEIMCKFKAEVQTDKVALMLEHSHCKPNIIFGISLYNMV